jgi:hypothetical protein
MIKVALRTAVAAAVFLATLWVTDRAIGIVYGPILKPVNDMGLTSTLSDAGTYLRPGFVGRFRTGEYSISISINAQGLRGPDVAPSAAGRYRIIALGDSFTFGQGVEYDQAWPELLARRAGPSVQVINAGWSASSPLGYERYLAARGLAFDPDLILVAVFVGNDVVDDLAELHAGPRPIDQIEYESQYLTNLQLRFGPIGAIRQVVDDQLPNLYELGTVALVRAQYALGSHRTHFDYVLADAGSPDIEAGWETTLAALSRIASLADSRGAKFGVVVIPFYDQVAPTSFPVGFTKDLPQQRIARYCAQRGLHCLDLLPALAAAGDPASLYYLKDGHWTSRGQTIASDAIGAWLAREALIPAPPK